MSLRPFGGLFVDQKWMDIGSSLFQASTFRHAGYNVGVANLSERPLDVDTEGYFIATTGERLRLFHFHAFDSSSPDDTIDTIPPHPENELGAESAVGQLCKEYAGCSSPTSRVCHRHLPTGTGRTPEDGGSHANSAGPTSETP